MLIAGALVLNVSTDRTLNAQSTASGAPVVRGSWAATAGPNQTFQGTWTAQASGTDPNTAQGSWTLLNQSRVAAQGTWSAVKTAASWSGSWQARAAGNNRLLSGMWRTELAASDKRSLTDLLQHTLEEQVSGSWSSGRLRGAWSLRGYR
jgi:hypothetical protein